MTTRFSLCTWIRYNHKRTLRFYYCNLKHVLVLYRTLRVWLITKILKNVSAFSQGVRWRAFVKVTASLAFHMLLTTRWLYIEVSYNRSPIRRFEEKETLITWVLHLIDTLQFTHILFTQRIKYNVLLWYYYHFRKSRIKKIISF